MQHETEIYCLARNLKQLSGNNQATGNHIGIRKSDKHNTYTLLRLHL